MGKFLVGLVVVNVAGAVACWITATKYPEETIAAALWGMGAVIGYLVVSIQAIHGLAPVQNGSRGLVGTVASGLMAALMAGWMIGIVLSMGASDGPALLEDFQLIAGSILRWASGLLS